MAILRATANTVSDLSLGGLQLLNRTVCSNTAEVVFN